MGDQTKSMQKLSIQHRTHNQLVIKVTTLVVPQKFPTRVFFQPYRKTLTQLRLRVENSCSLHKILCHAKRAEAVLSVGCTLSPKMESLAQLPLLPLRYLASFNMKFAQIFIINSNGKYSRDSFNNKTRFIYKITINQGNYTSFGKCFLYKSQSYKTINKLSRICRSKLQDESRMIQRSFDDNKGDEKNLKG